MEEVYRAATVSGINSEEEERNDNERWKGQALDGRRESNEGCE